MTGLPPDEAAVLAAVLLSPAEAFYAVDQEEGLRADDFQAPRLAAVYRAMRWLHDADGTFDRTTVRTWLVSHGEMSDADAAFTVDELAVPAGAANIRRYAKNVRDAARRRALAGLARTLLEQLGDATLTPDVLAGAERELLAIGHDDRQRTFRPIAEILDEEQERLAALSMSDVEMTGVPSGFSDLDDLLGGWQPGELILVGARPAMGKSAFVMNVSEYAALHGHGVALFSLEMSESEIAQRLMSSRSKVRMERLRRGQVLPERWPGIMASNAQLALAPLHVDDTAELTIADVRAKARRLALRSKVDLIVVDYLQLISPSRGLEGNRVQAVSEISRGLKLLARELEVPVIALSQLSRNLESRTDKRPQLSDLRESGSLEQDANVVVFLYREEVYEPETERKGKADVIVAKSRNTALDSIELDWTAAYVRFSDPEPPAPVDPLENWAHA